MPAAFSTVTSGEIATCIAVMIGATYRTVSLRRLQRQRLGHHLAEHDVEVGEDRHRHHAGHGVRGEPAVRRRSAISRGSIHPASTFSPYIPRPRLAIEMPIWVVAM